MDAYHKTRQAILDINQKTTEILHQAGKVIENSVSSFAQWEHSCANIQQNLIDHVMRIAVVGAIKSGKSTLVNALLQDDYLKRGAGVVTSIVTRIRKGEKLKARLYFKSWDEVNDDIEQALVLFPSDEWQARERRFDIRRSKDRSDLAAALSALDGELKIAKDSLNANSVLLSSYLKGFDQIQTYVEAERAIREFEDAEFGAHRDFVGDDALAVYLRDIQLDITGDALETNIEMADCQGSDSPNPLHMAMIQDYLLKAHLIIYVISSRTGLRQADIRFLSIIKQMGIADNMLFVCNCDFNEHESTQDLEALVDRIKEELYLVLPDPLVFVFSALYHLFDVHPSKLSRRDKDRLHQWTKVTDLVTISDAEILRLKRALMRKLTRERSALLLQNQLERVDIVQTGLSNWIKLHKNILKRDAADAESMADRIQSHQGYMVQVQTMIRGTLDGSIQKINMELKKEIDRFFDQHSGPVLQKVVGFIRNYNIDLNSFAGRVVDVGFNHSLYLVFQEFKQSVDAFMAEAVNPEIIGFIGRLETQLREYFQSIVAPFEAMVRDAVQQYEASLVQFGLEQLPGQWALDTVPDLENIKKSIGLELPAASATMRYSAHIKTDAVMRLGFYTLLRMVRKLLKKQADASGSEEVQALKGGIRRMKRETERSVYEHFKDYQENIKFQYILKLVDATSSRLYEGLTEHFRVYVSDLKDVISSMGSERHDKEQVDAALDEIEQGIRSLNSRIGTLRQEIIQMRGEDTDGGSLKNVASVPT